MAIFDPVKAITGTSLGGTITAAGQSIANKLNSSLPGLKNGLSRTNATTTIIAEPLADRRIVPSSQMLVFPSDLPDQLAHFKLDIKEYRKPTADQQGRDTLLGTVYLPLPSNITEGFNMNYNSAQFGPILGDPALQKVMGSLGNRITGATSGELTSDEKEQSKQLGTNIGKGAAPYVLRSLARAVLETGGVQRQTAEGVIDVFQGATPNPGLALLFQSNSFRKFTYNWRLAPTSKEDAMMMEKIINIIRFGMHPGREGFFLSFPYRFFPKMVVKGNEIIKYKPCVVESFNVDYAPGSLPAFFTDGKPLEVNISISMQETEIFTRNELSLGQTNMGGEGE